MRIVSWNCNLSLGRKISRLLELRPDIAIVQECEKTLQAPSGYNFLWCGNNPRKGLGILTRELTLVANELQRSEWTYFLPCTVPEKRLRILAAWAYNHRAERRGPEYVGGLMPVLAELGSWLSEGRSIVAGDFNNSVIWDKAGGRYNFADINSLLGRLGLESAYHAHTAESPGQESNHTYFHTKNLAKGFHIDYCFVHRSIPVAAVSVPKYSDWRTESDHVPLIIDVNDG